MSGPRRSHQLEELLAGTGVAHHLHVVEVLNGAPYPRDDQRVIVGEQNLDPGAGHLVAVRAGVLN